MSLSAEKKKIIRKIESLQQEFWRISDAIWGFAELALEEYRSAELLSNTLEKAGFEVSRGLAGMETAFTATWRNGSGRPVIGLTGEYDALPALSQKCGVPYQTPLIRGAPGHGCSHNTMGTMSALAVVALRDTVQKNDLDATLIYFGCPAEEIGVSRPYMIQAGLFKGVDALIDCHADFIYKTTYGMLGNALYSALFTFKGKSSHAAFRPWQGRSAGDAVELMHAATERMREHVPLTNRIHWVTTFAGDAPNIVPEEATTWYYIRDLDENLEAVVQWVHACAKGAALMTQTRYQVNVLSAIHQRFYNRTIAEQLYINMKATGKPRYTNAEKAFALALQKGVGVPQIGLKYPLALVDAEKDSPRASSSDMGDVCLCVPTGQISIPVWVPGIPAHSWSATAVGATSIAHKGISTAAKAVALTVYDLLTDPNVLKQIKAEFFRLKHQRPYKPFLPRGAKPPLGFYKNMMAKYRKELMENGNKALNA